MSSSLTPERRGARLTQREQFQLLLNECEIWWPDRHTRLAGSALAGYLDVIESEAVDRRLAELREAADASVRVEIAEAVETLWHERGWHSIEDSAAMQAVLRIVVPKGIDIARLDAALLTSDARDRSPE